MNDSCQRTSRNISAYLDGELGPAESGALKAHVAVCGPCACELRAAAGRDAELKRLPGVEPGPFFSARVMAVVRSLNEGRAPLRRFLRLPLPAMALMLALIMANILSFSVNISAMEPAARRGLVRKVVSCMQNPETLVNPAALVRLCNHCGDYICSCMKDCDMKSGKKCPICNTGHMEKK